MAETTDGQFWDEYLQLLQEAERQLSQAKWFEDGWEVQTGTMMSGASPRGVAFRLTKPAWFEGAIHWESWLSNADLKRGTLPVALHVETNQEKTGLNKNQFVGLLLERGAGVIASWEGYIVKEKYAAEPLRRNVPFDKTNLVAQIVAEYSRRQLLQPAINQIIVELAG
jgi:hypothetical protein